MDTGLGFGGAQGRSLQLQEGSSIMTDLTCSLQDLIEGSGLASCIFSSCRLSAFSGWASIALPWHIGDEPQLPPLRMDVRLNARSSRRSAISYRCCSGNPTRFSADAHLHMIAPLSHRKRRRTIWSLQPVMFPNLPLQQNRNTGSQHRWL